MDSSILIILFVGGVFASSHFSIESANGFQSFRPIGKFQQHVSHAHFDVELHFGVFKERVNGLRKTVSSLDETKVSPYLKSTFARLTAMIEETASKLHQYKQFFSGGRQPSAKETGHVICWRRFQCSGFV